MRCFLNQLVSAPAPRKPPPLSTTPTRIVRDWISKHYSSLIAEALEEMHGADVRISFVVAESRDSMTDGFCVASSDAGFHSIDERFDRVNHELAAIRRDVGAILAKVSSA